MERSEIRDELRRWADTVATSFHGAYFFTGALALSGVCRVVLLVLAVALAMDDLEPSQ